MRLSALSAKFGCTLYWDGLSSSHNGLIRGHNSSAITPVRGRIHNELNNTEE
jgi:hypothetical protein